MRKYEQFVAYLATINDAIDLASLAIDVIVFVVDVGLRMTVGYLMPVMVFVWNAICPPGLIFWRINGLMQSIAAAGRCLVAAMTQQREQEAMTTKNAAEADLTLAGAGQKPRLWYVLKRLLGLNKDIDFDKINRKVADEAMRKYNSPEERALRERAFRRLEQNILRETEKSAPGE